MSPLAAHKAWSAMISLRFAWPARTKTAVLSGKGLVRAAASLELSAIDGELIESDGHHSPSLETLIEEKLRQSRKHTTHSHRLCGHPDAGSSHQQFAHVARFEERCHLMPHAADALGRLFRDSGAHLNAGWDAPLARRFMHASDWAVAQLGTMFPVGERLSGDIVELFESDFLNSGSVALTGLAAQRLATWEGIKAREPIRACGRSTESAHIRRIVALTDLSLDLDRDFIDGLLADVAECRPTQEMLVDRGYRPNLARHHSIP